MIMLLQAPKKNFEGLSSRKEAIGKKNDGQQWQYNSSNLSSVFYHPLNTSQSLAAAKTYQKNTYNKSTAAANYKKVHTASAFRMFFTQQMRS
jgi:hypothetical protein